MRPLLKVLLAGACVCLTLAITACNTTKGFGTDIKKAGEGLEGSADRNGAD